MNIENLKKLLNNKEDFKAFFTAGTREASLKCLNDHGVDVKDEELDVVLLAIDKLVGGDRMDMDDMDAVAGGRDIIVDVGNIVGAGFQLTTIPYTAPIQLAAGAIKEGITMVENLYASITGDINKEQMDAYKADALAWKEDFDQWLKTHH